MTALQDLSLGEIHSLCLKAARGAGLPWGVAEEAADAVRVLSRIGVRGADLIMLCLTEGQLDPNGGVTLGTGIGISDRAATFAANAPVTLPAVPQVALLLPFISRAARSQGKTIFVDGGGVMALCRVDGTFAGHIPYQVDVVSLRCEQTTVTRPLPALPVQNRAMVARDVLDTLEALAAKTYAPATDASRRSGAGAGETDQD